MGYNEFPGVAGYGHAALRFQGDSVQVVPAALAFNFESTMAVRSDSAGQLLFYSNGCAIANRNHQIMPNGAGLNPGDISDLVCPWKGYIVPQGAMPLPLPGQPGRYCLLHIGASYDPVRKLKLGPLYCTEIDMSQDGGLGEVTSINKVLLAGDLGAFTAVRHGNGRDWWVLAPAFGGALWHTFLLSPSGFSEQPPQALLSMLPACEKHGATVAALRGDRIANWGDCKVSIYRFDRCTGVLSDEMELPAPKHWVPGGGLAFSPSGRYLYATSQTVLFRADLEALSPRLDTMRFSYDPLLKSEYDVPGNTFHYLENGPDGRIYGNIPSRAAFLHLLNKPDGSTKADIDFVARGVKLPVTGVRTLPNFPNYRLGDLHASPCDTLGINPTVEATAQGLQRVALAPNPARAEVFLSDHSESLSQARSWRLYAPTGACVLRAALAPGVREQAIPLGDLPAGLYFWELCWPDGRRAAGKMGIEN
jgi:hypothetical protein